jgi:hypothetical protein
MKPRSKQETERGVVFAKGGKGHMLPEQAAGKARSGISGKAQTTAPGAKSAKGGQKTHGYGLSKPAAPGRTAPPRKGR